MIDKMLSELKTLGLDVHIIRVLSNEKNKPEGKIRISWIHRVITEYGYPVKHLSINVSAGIGRDAGKSNTPVRADIVIYRDTNKMQPFIVIETKAENEKNGLEQAESYSRNLGAEFHVWSDGKYSLFFKTARFAKLSESISDIPNWISDKPIAAKISKNKKLPPFKDEEDLRKTISSCHDLILEKQGHDPAKAFDEITKLLFLKLFDEREVPKFYEFVVLVNEDPMDVAKRIRDLFSKSVKTSKYADLFFQKFQKKPQIHLDLDDRTIFSIVQKLQAYSLVNTTENIHGADIKGTVFEKMVGRTFRGELAQFFTPREIVDFMIDVLSPAKEDVIFDPACGSGGFLIMCLRKVKERLRTEFPNLSQSDIEQQVKYFAENNLFGVDINERMIRVAKMNMTMHGDGHAGILHENGLLTSDQIPDYFRNKVKDCTIMVSNPPFAGRETDPSILSRFDTSTNRTGKTTSVSKELLFIENLIKLSKPGTKIGLVIPSGCFNNPSYSYVKIRNLIKEKTKILSIIALPHDAFRISGANNEGNLLFLERVKKPQKDYTIYIDWASHVGFDATGRKIPENDLPKIFERMKNPELKNKIKLSQLRDRIDPWYYHPRYAELEAAISKTKYNLESISNVVEKSDTLFNAKDNLDKSFRYIKTSHVDSSTGKITGFDCITGKNAPNRAKYILKEGDFLIPNARDTLSRISVIGKEHNGYVGSNRFFVVRPKLDKINPTYLYHMLKQPVILALIKKQATGEINPGMTMSENINALEKVKIPLPNISQQKELVDKIIKNENRKNELIKEIEKIDKSVLSLVGTSLPEIETNDENFGILGYEFISFF